MDNIFKDEAKIKLFVHIQDCLSDLEPNSGNEEIEQVIKEIPKSYLDNKDDLMVICSIFAYNARNNIKNKQGNTIKLFEKIMEPIKKYLQNESSFFWNIFGSIYYLKHWMYEEGLVSIDTIIQSAMADNTHSIIKYFLPEIFEKEPEIFENEFKSIIEIPFSIEYINEFKELRKKHFKWIRESNDYNDPIYREIEKNQLRLSIKCDDIDSFQSILSNSNISIDSMIQESVLENVYLNPHEISLLDYAIDFDSIKIFKYLYLNGAKASLQSIFNSISNRNYEMIHLIESMSEDKFENNCLCFSVMCCNLEMTKYAIENYNYGFLENENVDPKKIDLISDIVYNMCYSSNFRFLYSIFLPFLKKNPKFVEENIHEMIFNSMKDYSCFFIKEFLKYPKININYYSEKNDDDSFLVNAIEKRNVRAAEILLNDPNIEIGNKKYDNFSPFHDAIAYYSDLKFLELFVENPKFDVIKIDEDSKLTAFNVAIIRNNFYAIDFILNKLPNCNGQYIPHLLYISFQNKYGMAFKSLLKFTLKQFKELNDEEIIDKLKNELFSLSDYNEEFIAKVQKVLHEIKSSSYE